MVIQGISLDLFPIIMLCLMRSVIVASFTNEFYQVSVERHLLKWIAYKFWLASWYLRWLVLLIVDESTKDAEFKLAQSGDATCNGLDSAEVSLLVATQQPRPNAISSHMHLKQLWKYFTFGAEF